MAGFAQVRTSIQNLSRKIGDKHPALRAVRSRYLPSKMLLALEVPLILGSFTRGYDFLRVPDPELAVIPIITALLPMYVWGWLFLGGSLLLGVGVTTWRHLCVFLGHSFLAVVHAGFMCGAASVTLPAGEFRAPAALLLPAVIHFIVAWNLGPIAKKAETDAE